MPHLRGVGKGAYIERKRRGIFSAVLEEVKQTEIKV
jgi:hypothetical protein